MKRVSIATGLVIFALSVYATVTNITQLLNVPLSEEVMSCLPSRNYDTPELAYLSFIKAYLTSNARDMLAGFKTNDIYRITGYTNPDLLSESQQHYMRELLGPVSVSNCVVLSYSITTNDSVKIEAEIQTKFNDSIETNSYPIGFRKVAGKWKIEEFLDDFE